MAENARFPPRYVATVQISRHRGRRRRDRVFPPPPSVESATFDDHVRAFFARARGLVPIVHSGCSCAVFNIVFRVNK